MKIDLKTLPMIVTYKYLPGAQVAYILTFYYS